jgi:hypothetical protein
MNEHSWPIESFPCIASCGTGQQKSELRTRGATIQEDHMRSTSLVLAALAGLAASTFAVPAGAFTPGSSAGVGAAAQTIDPVASVHCRPFKHRSPDHRWGYGCRGGRVSIHEHEGVRGRVSVHEREGTRSRVDVRERERSTGRTDVRTRDRTKARGEVKTETTRGSTTGKSGTTNKSTTRSGGGSSGGGTSGQPSGEKH